MGTTKTTLEEKKHPVELDMFLNPLSVQMAQFSKILENADVAEQWKFPVEIINSGDSRW